ncbi:MAG: hypothetical protein ACRDQV_17450 [Pseudonocardiaceae bacterium]
MEARTVQAQADELIRSAAATRRQAARRLVDTDEDEPLLLAALCKVGADVEIVAWDDPIADWSAFDLAVVRSTWDYALRCAAFLA